MKRKRPSRDEVRRVYEQVDALDLGDGATFALIADRLGVEYGDVAELLIWAFPEGEVTP